MGNSNVDQAVKSNKKLKDRVRAYLLNKDRLRDSYRKDVMVYRSLEFITGIINGSPSAAIKEIELAETNPQLRSVAAIKTDAQKMLVMLDKMFEQEDIAREIIHQHIIHEIEIKNELMDAEIKEEWKNKKNELMAMNNQQLLVEKQKIEEAVRLENEQKAKQDVEKIKAERAKVVALIATLTTSIASRYQNIERLETNIANRNITISRLEEDISRRNERIADLKDILQDKIKDVSAKFDAVINELADDEIRFKHTLSTPPQKVLDSLKEAGIEFNAERVVEKNDIKAMAKSIIMQNMSDAIKNEDVTKLEMAPKSVVTQVLEGLAYIQRGEMTEVMKQVCLPFQEDLQKAEAVLIQEIEQQVEKLYENKSLNLMQTFNDIKSNIVEICEARLENTAAENNINEQKILNEKDREEIKVEKVEVKREEGELSRMEMEALKEQMENKKNETKSVSDEDLDDVDLGFDDVEEVVGQQYADEIGNTEQPHYDKPSTALFFDKLGVTPENGKAIAESQEKKSDLVDTKSKDLEKSQKVSERPSSKRTVTDKETLQQKLESSKQDKNPDSKISKGP